MLKQIAPINIVQVKQSFLIPTYRTNSDKKTSVTVDVEIPPQTEKPSLYNMLLSSIKYR